MPKAILGRKIGMTQWWNKDKQAEAVTLVDCAGCFVSGKRTMEKDGYEASVLGIKEKKGKKEKVTLLKECPPVEEVKLSSFKEKDKVNVCAVSKGKGFQGVVRRHGFSGGPKTHGHRHALRRGGSIGCAFPEHVLKGKKMPGRMGAEQVTQKNRIAYIDEEKNIIAVKGAVPGRKGSWVKILSKE